MIAERTAAHEITCIHFHANAEVPFEHPPSCSSREFVAVLTGCSLWTGPLSGRTANHQGASN